MRPTSRRPVAIEVVGAHIPRILCHVVEEAKSGVLDLVFGRGVEAV